MRVLISGLRGFMGREVEALCAAGYQNASAVCGVDITADGSEKIPCYRSFKDAPTNVDCIVDFSNHASTVDLLDFAVENRIPVVLATTGQTEDERKAILRAANEIPIFFAANYSIGVAVLIETAKKVAAALPNADIEIVETHHIRKLDAPSGTALAIAEGIREVRPSATVVMGRSGKRQPGEINVHSLRIGDIVGIHEVIVGTPTQTITLKHEAHTRRVFAEGALAAAAFLTGRGAGLYKISDLL